MNATTLNTMKDEMEKNCGTCKHRGDEPVEARWHNRETVITFYECKRVRHDEGWEYKPGERAVVIDGSGYHSALCVEDTFGCVLWEAK